MHQISSDKFCVLKCNDSARSPESFTACGKSYTAFTDRDNPAVGNGNLMGIFSEIFDGIAKAVECFFDIRAPFFIVTQRSLLNGIFCITMTAMVRK